VAFRTAGVDPTNTYDPLALYVASIVIADIVDMRDIKEDLCFYKSWAYSKYLPLTSHTQIVEAGAKEAKLVSQSDRSEQLRSGHAINRSLQESILQEVEIKSLVN
jgi:hypothetical protein